MQADKFKNKVRQNKQCSTMLHDHVGVSDITGFFALSATFQPSCCLVIQLHIMQLLMLKQRSNNAQSRALKSSCSPSSSDRL